MTFPISILVIISLIYQNGVSPGTLQLLSRPAGIRFISRNISRPPNDHLKTLELPSHHCPHFCQCTISTNILSIERCSHNPANHLDPLLLNALNISSLTITYSFLSHLPMVVCNLTELTRLDVSQNELDSLPWNCLKQMSNLQSIIASSNHIRRLENGSFYDFPSLQELVLEHNHISKIDFDVFTQVDRLSLLSVINLGGNRLESIDPWPLMFMDSLPRITLSNNLISSFTNNINWTYKCNYKKPSAYVDLQHNNITHMTDLFNWFGGEHEGDYSCGKYGLSKLDITYNPFICDCIDYEIYNHLYVIWTSEVAQYLLCKAPQRLYDQRIFMVPLDEFVCHVDERCPKNCECIHQPNQMIISISCKESGLTELPKLLPSLPKRNYTYLLSFPNNQIKSVQYRGYFEHTRTAIFSYNKIRNISFSAFSALSKADVLYLDHNKLQYLPSNVSDINITTLTDLRMEANNWRCDCHAKETNNWMNVVKNVISDNQGILCNEPANLANINLLSLTDEQLICGMLLDKVLLASLVSVGGTVILCLVLIVTPVGIISKYRVWVYKKIHWHPFDSDECEGENKEFDIFVSYANENENFVEQHIISELEQKGYKVAFHRVHFLAGQPIHVSIEECILKSKRTLVVFSKEFIDSAWCMWEFTVALEHDGNEGTHRLLTIKYGDINFSYLDDTLQAYFKRHTYIEHDSSRFWDNLEYNLPVKKMGGDGVAAHNVQNHPYPAAETVAQQNFNDRGDNANEDTVLLQNFP